MGLRQLLFASPQRGEVTEEQRKLMTHFHRCAV